MKRPACVNNKHLKYLDELRESGITNMYGAGDYLDDEFPELSDGKPSRHPSPKAREILEYWMKTFREPTR